MESKLKRKDKNIAIYPIGLLNETYSFVYHTDGELEMSFGIRKEGEKISSKKFLKRIEYKNEKNLSKTERECLEERMAAALLEMEERQEREAGTEWMDVWIVAICENEKIYTSVYTAEKEAIQMLIRQLKEFFPLQFTFDFPSWA